MAVGDMYGVQVRYTVGTEWCYTRLLYKVITQGSPDRVMAARLVSTLATFQFGNVWKGWNGIDSWLREIYARRVHPSPGVPGAKVLASAGVDAEGSCPPGAPVCLSLYADEAGRSYRGRQYWSGVGTSGPTGGVLSQSKLELIISFAGVLLDPATDVGGVVDEWTLQVWRDPVAESADCTSIRVNTNLRVMKTRVSKPYWVFEG